MKVELSPGEEVVVTFKDSDGEITVSFNRRSITVHTDLPDTAGRQGIIYKESFGNVSRRYNRMLKRMGEIDGGHIPLAADLQGEEQGRDEPDP